MAYRLLTATIGLLAAVAVLATSAGGTGGGSDNNTTATVTINGSAPSGNYSAHAVAASFTTDAPVDYTCDMDMTFTLDANGNGTITNWEYSNCSSGCTVVVTLATTTVAGTSGQARFEVTSATPDGADWDLVGDFTYDFTCLVFRVCTQLPQATALAQRLITAASVREPPAS
jgi:hypothetical protein